MHLYNTVNNQNQQKLKVWAGIIGREIIDPFFIYGTLTASRYLELLEDTILQVLREKSVFNELLYQHDGAPGHSAQIIKHYLNENFQSRWIRRGCLIRWPPRSPDLTPLDFFLWGHLNSTVYHDLKRRIITECRNISEAVLQNVLRSFQHRLEICLSQNGGIFEHLL